MGSTPKVCTASDQCHTAGTCDSASGNCSNPVAANGTSCNADNNACTQSDSCQNGTCQAGAALVCTVPDLCHQAGTCNASSGVCAPGTVVSCPANEYCALADGSCANCSTPDHAQGYAVTSIAGMALDGSGNQYVIASLYGTGVSFGGVSVTSAGGGDLVLAKLDPTTGLATGTGNWAHVFSGASGDENPGPADQIAVGIAVSQSGNVGAIGNFTGGLQVGTTHVAGGASPIDFIIGTDNTGAGLWGRSANMQQGALTAIASNAARDEFVVCGYAQGPVTDLGLPGVSGGDAFEDIVVAKLNASTGAVIWSRQIAAAGTQLCAAVTMDSTGAVFATGLYNGAPDLGTGAFPTLASSVNAIWVAKFDGTTGTTLAAAHYGTLSKQAARGIAVDSSGHVAVAGNLKTSMSFGSTNLVAGGNTDGYVALLDASLAPVWAKSWGDALVQEAHGVAFNSVGDVVVVGYIKGTATFVTSSGSVVLTANATTNSDAYYVKFRGSEGTALCAANYGDSQGQVADIVAISTATGTQKDKINIAGYSTGTITFGSTVLTSAVSNGFVAQLTP